MDITDLASMDFETASCCDLRKTGAAIYAKDLTTRMTVLAAVVPGVVPMERDMGLDPMLTGDYLSGPPRALVEWIGDGGKVSGWNVLFEYWIWNRVLPRQFPKLNLPELKLPQLVDTMAIAAFNGLPLSLDTASQALEPVLGIVKDKEGHALMLRMSRPRDRKTDSWWHEDDLEKFARLRSYCQTDVRVERKILEYLPNMHRREREIWQMDAETHVRGMTLDRKLVNSMQAHADAEQARLNEAMDAVTGGDVEKTTNVGGLLKWVQAEGRKAGFRRVPSSLAKDQLSDILDKGSYPLTPAMREALEIRQEAAKSSVAKLKAMLLWADGDDDRMRGLIQHYGAFRSGRDAGRGPQVQNYPRSVVKDQEYLVEFLLDMADKPAPGMLPLIFGESALACLASALRGCITVDDGLVFGSIDFSQIEARVGPWLAGDRRKLEVFAQGKDLYVVAAAPIYGVTQALVDNTMRQIGKVSELALSFGGGKGAFQSMAKIYGIEVSDERAEEIKIKWRRSNPKIVRMWDTLERAALKAVQSPGTIVTVAGKIRFGMKGDGHLRMQLPSTRWITYRNAEVGTGTFGGKAVTYMDLDQYTRKWKRVSTYGGQLFNNAVQGTARDILKDANLRVRAQIASGDLPDGVSMLGSIHDETLFELPSHDAYDVLLPVYSKNPDWCPDMPLDAAGYVGQRFKKD